MKLKVFAVIDTNVIVSSLLSEKGFPSEILGLVKEGNVIPIFDKRMLNEYYKVLNYQKFKDKFLSQDIYDTLYSVVENGIMVNDVEHTKEYFKDKDDIPFYEVTMTSSEFSPYLVTGNIKHFPKTSYIVLPQVMLATMAYMEKFIIRDLDYDKVIQNLIQTQTSTPKYAIGKNLVDKIFNVKEKTIKNEYFERD